MKVLQRVKYTTQKLVGQLIRKNLDMSEFDPDSWGTFFLKFQRLN